jgi:hypothetical protein
MTYELTPPFEEARDILAGGISADLWPDLLLKPAGPSPERG